MATWLFGDISNFVKTNNFLLKYQNTENLGMWYLNTVLVNVLTLDQHISIIWEHCRKEDS